MIAIRKITAPSRSCNSRPVCPTRCIITAPINTVRVRAPNSHQPICNPVAARCNGTLSAHGAGSIGFKPSLNNRRLNNENQHPHQQLPAIAIGTDQTPQPEIDQHQRHGANQRMFGKKRQHQATPARNNERKIALATV
jgi:hypothetical protein